MSLPDRRKVIALDFDGVLHDYHGWNGGKTGEPIPGMIVLVDILVAKGAYVIVFTTRDKMIVAEWLALHGFPAMDVRNDKWSRIDVFVDDCAVTFTPKHVRVAPEVFARELLDFEPHWRNS